MLHATDTGFIKGGALRKLTSFEHDFAAWFDHLEKNFSNIRGSLLIVLCACVKID